MTKMVAGSAVRLMLLMVLIGSEVVHAQYKNITIDRFSKENPMANPAVAVNKRDSKRIVATAFDMIYTSTDGGATWDKNKLTSPALSTDNRILLFDSKGTLFAFHCVGESTGPGRLVCQQSKDNGRTWDEPVPINPDASRTQAFPSVTTDTKGEFYVTWTEYSIPDVGDTSCRAKVYLSTSSSGKKWSKPVALSVDGGGCDMNDSAVTGAVPAAGPDGKIFASWFGSGKLYLDRSYAHGMWLQNDIAINTQVAPFNLKVPGHAMTTSLPQLGIDQTKGTYHGCLYVAWADKRNGPDDSDVFFMRSNNHGDNWSSPVRLGSAAKDKYQYAPRMAMDQTTGYIYVLYYDRGEYDDAQTDVYLSYSSDSGGSFKAVKINETPFTPDDKSALGLYLNIAASNGVIVPVWSQMDKGEAVLMTATISQADLVKPVEIKAKKKK